MQKAVESRDQSHALFVGDRLLGFDSAQDTLLVLARLQAEEFAHGEDEQTEDVALVEEVAVVGVGVGEHAQCLA